MLITHKKAGELSDELIRRYSELQRQLNGRPCTVGDSKHGLARGYWAPDTLSYSRIISDTSLRLAIADFKSILTEIGRLK
jgi:hypothetical protein